MRAESRGGEGPTYHGAAAWSTGADGCAKSVVTGARGRGNGHDRRRMMGRGMTSRARQTAAIVGILGALALPKKTPCLAPNLTCDVVQRDGWTCTPTDLEPLGI